MDDEGRAYASPQYFARGLRKTRQLNRDLSHKVEGSNGYKRARRALAKHLADIANQRLDHHFKLARQLCDERDTLYFEDLNLVGMKALWGRKVSDLGFASFVNILDWVAFRRGKSVQKIGRWQRTTGKCSRCAYSGDGLARADVSLRTLWPHHRARSQFGYQYQLCRGICTLPERH
jgi:putative transposase